jgi:hypothetical protein
LDKRAARTEHLTAPKRTTLKKALITIEKAWHRVNRVKGGENGLHFSSGHFPAGSGFGYGLGYIKGDGFSQKRLGFLFSVEFSQHGPTVHTRPGGRLSAQAIHLDCLKETLFRFLVIS